MNLQASICCKRLFTDFTIVWLCSSVSELMTFENLRLGERLVALSTLERLLSSMSELMFLKISTLAEGFVALSALERLVSCVDSHVLYQVFN